MKALPISLLFSMLTLAAAGGYWIVTGLAPNGPVDDMAIFYLLAIPILIHAVLVARYGFREAFTGTVLYASVVAGLCMARHQQVAWHPGYDAWHVGRSLTALGWCLLLLAVGPGLGYLDE